MGTGLAAAIAFLGLNDLWLDADPDAFGEQVLGVARGSSTKADVAVFIRLHVVPLQE